MINVRLRAAWTGKARRRRRWPKPKRGWLAAARGVAPQRHRSRWWRVMVEAEDKTLAQHWAQVIAQAIDGQVR